MQVIEETKIHVCTCIQATTCLETNLWYAGRLINAVLHVSV